MKITKTEMYDELKKALAGETTEVSLDDFLEFINHEQELLANKKHSTKPTAKQLENQGFCDVICDILRNATKPLTIAEIVAENATLATLTNQRISALLTNMRNAEMITREYDKKGKAHFALA